MEDFRSEGREVFLFQNNFFLLFSVSFLKVFPPLASFSRLLFSCFLRLFFRCLGIKTQNFRINAGGNTIGVLFFRLLLFAFLLVIFSSLFIFLGLEDFQLFLFDPLSVDLAFFDWLLLSNSLNLINLDTLVSIIFIKGDSLRLFWFFFFSLFDNFSDFTFFFSFFLVKLISKTTNGSSFSRPIVSTSAASAIVIMAISQLFLGFGSIVSSFSVLFDFFRDSLIGRLNRPLGSFFCLLYLLLFC